MSDFYYEARDEQGRAISGRIRAMDVKDAIRQLEANHWDVLSVRTVPKSPADSDNAFEDSAHKELKPNAGQFEEELPRLSKKEQAEFAGHLADVMEAGLPLVSGLLALAEELPDGRVRRGLRVMAAQLEAGRSLQSVLESPNVPADLRGLIRAGVRSGQTGEILSHYVKHTQRWHDIRRRMALAWGYPLVLVLTAGAIFFFFIWYLVPKFAKIYEDFGTELPYMTKSLIDLSRFIRRDWPILLAVLAGLGLILWLIWQKYLSPAQRRRVLWCLPILGNMIRSAAIARFARLLGLLIESGVPLPEALRLAGQGAADAELGEAAMHLADVVESGRPIQENEYACQRFPRTFVQLLSQVDGQKPQAASVRALSEACISGANMFESRARAASTRIAALSQPLMLFLIGGLVGYLVIAMFLPLIKLLNDLS